MNQPVEADLFCEVVDNLGDIGVMWRLARQMTNEKGWRIRLWVDRLESLTAIEPAIDHRLPAQTLRNVEVLRWPDPWIAIEPHAVVIAGFSCELPGQYLERLAQTPDAIWIQLEYLSAEDWVGSFHGLHSQRNDKLKPVFFFPGFAKDTGGLIRERDLLKQRKEWSEQGRSGQWLKSIGVRAPSGARLVSVFTYPHAPLHRLMEQLRLTGERFHLLVPSRTTYPNEQLQERISVQPIAFLDQAGYDRLLWSCDLNLVRGEDSLVRAIWAAKPLLWQVYPQKDGAHHDKLEAWLKVAVPPPVVGQVMHEWADGNLHSDITPSLVSDGWGAWCESSLSLCKKLAQQTDLATRLDSWVGAQTVMADRL